jgi:hypothetical protein
MHVLAQVLGCAALAGLGDLINRRHDLPSRQRGDGEVEVIFETPSERRHCWFPVDDLAAGQRRFVGAIFNDQDRQRRALLVGELLPLDLALGLVRIDHLASGDGRGLLIELGPCAQRLALGASRPRLGEQEDPGPPTCRAHPDRKPWLLCVVEIVLRLARRQRGRTDRRVSELQVVLWPEIFTVRFHRLYPYSLCPGTRRGRPKKRITNRSRHVPSENPCAARTFTTILWRLIRLARVYGLWFTRERSKVRSLVRPPYLILPPGPAATFTDGAQSAIPALTQALEIGRTRRRALVR